MKTKNVPKGLKCKINDNIFFRIRGSQKGGMGPPLGKNSQIIPYFFLSASIIEVQSRVTYKFLFIRGSACLEIVGVQN